MKCVYRREYPSKALRISIAKLTIGENRPHVRASIYTSHCRSSQNVQVDQHGGSEVGIAAGHRSQHVGQPLTYQILERLGVLAAASQDDAEDADSSWSVDEEHPLEDSITYTSRAASPDQTAFSPVAHHPIRTVLPPSTMIAPAYSKPEADLIGTDQDLLGMPGLAMRLPCPYPGPSFSTDVAYTVQV